MSYIQNYSTVEILNTVLPFFKNLKLIAHRLKYFAGTILLHRVPEKLKKVKRVTFPKSFTCRCQ